MNRERLGWWLTLLANVGVLGGLVFVGLEVRQNTRQLRAEASYSITESVNAMNAGVYGDATLSDLLIRGEQSFASLSEVERQRFAAFQFSRINIAEYVLDLETEGVGDINFRFVDFIVNDYRSKPGLQEFIRSVEDVWQGSDQLYSRLAGP